MNSREKNKSRGENVGKGQTKPPSQIPERAIKVIRLGFEPKTHSLEGCCSIQLSYRTDPFAFGGRGAFLRISHRFCRKWLQR